MSLSKTHIGTSGWYYRQWRGLVYPKDISPKFWLKYYATIFRSVEINSSFYHLPTEETIEHWRSQVSPDFKFSVKASRYITHQKRLNNASNALDLFLNRISNFGHNLGPVLFQLPSNKPISEKHLKTFIENCPQDFQYVFELRHPDYFKETIYNLFKIHNIAFCIFDFFNFKSPVIKTANFTYTRMHGTTDLYQGKYSDQVLKEWASLLNDWGQAGLSNYLYFNNDKNGASFENGIQLQQYINTKI